jgi:membrane protease YdiL (CAAX protease family)
MKEGSKKLRLVFLVFIALFIVNLVVPLIGFSSHTQRLWVISSVTIAVLSVLILIKEKLPGKDTIALGLVLAFLVGLIRPFTGVVTFLAFLASMRIMGKADDGVVILRRPYSLSIFLGVGVGLVLGFINLFLAGVQMKFVPSFYAFVLSLNPGISEEVIYRLFMYAFSIYLLGGRISTRKEAVWLYVLVIVPHVLLHFPDSYFVNGSLHLDLGMLLVSPVLLALLFGLPMTLAMLKRDLASAMLIHTIVDFIRFIFLGLPF